MWMLIGGLAGLTGGIIIGTTITSIMFIKFIEDPDDWEIY